MKTKQRLLVHFTSKILVVLVVCTQVAKAQDSESFKNGTYRVVIGASPDNKISLGYLSSISDTSIYVSSVPVKFNGYANPNSMLRGISYKEIYDVKLRRRGSTAIGLLIGAVSGAAVGALLGYAGGDDKPKDSNDWCIFCFTAGQKARIGGFALGSIGLVIGGLVGNNYQKTYTIKNNQEGFDELKWSLTH